MQARQRTRNVATSIALALSFVPIALAAQGVAPADIDWRADGSGWVRGELVVALDEAVEASASVEARVAALGGRVVERVPRLGLLRVVLAEGADADAAEPLYRALPGVRYVERNGVGEGGGLPPNDTFFGSQWHHQNGNGADINTLEAWSTETGDSGIVVAVLDSGIDFAHPEFAGRLLPGFDFVNQDNDPTADHSHGILVTGLLAANADNGFGVAGVDHACTVLPVKVLNANNAGTIFDLVQGLDYAAAEGADVISMSLINYTGTQSLRNALAAARDAGSILVACGGNSGVGDANVSWPGASARTIAVGWTGSNDQRSSASGTGTRLDFVAPGLNVITASTSVADTFAFFSGCSAATPVAAGVVSLLLAQDPTLTQAEVYQILRLSAADQLGFGPDLPGRDDFYGHGRLDALAALECLSECIGETYCDVTPNSFSSGARISARGSDVVADGDVTLRITFAPPGVFGLFFTGPNQIETAFGDGLRCVGGMTTRIHPVLQVSPAGDGSRALDLQALGVVPGTSSNFQFWFRDSGPAAFNLSDGIGVAWQ